MRMLFQVKWDVACALCHKYAKLATSMRVPNLVKDIWILICHVSNNKICIVDLSIDPLQNGFSKLLFINPFCNNANFVTGLFDSKLVHIIKFGGKWHQNKCKGL